MARKRYDPHCIFCQIVEKKLDASLVYEDEAVSVFLDRFPQAPVHALIIPKEHFTSLNEMETEQPLLGHMMHTAILMAKELKIFESGFRTTINTGIEGGQAIDHLHIHLLGGTQMGPSLVGGS
jgi:histidine triad (HIT) family protein